MVEAETLISVMLDNACPEEVEGDIHHFSIDLHCVVLDVTARLIKPCDVTPNMEVIRGKWEIISYDINEFWA